jgi:hypothetical protein
LHGHPRSADHSKTILLPHAIQNLTHAKSLDAHPRHADDVSPSDALEVQRLDVLVEYRDAKFIRSECGEQG